MPLTGVVIYMYMVAFVLAREKCSKKGFWIPGTCTAELQWLKHLWNHENKFETGTVRAKER